MTEADRPPLHLAVALDGAGWHPAAWREPLARPGDLLTAGYWAGLVTEAEAGLLDFVTLEDALSLQSMHRLEPDGATDQVRGRLDAVLTAARVAPLTRHIGLIPTVVVTHTEPFHISKAIATLDYVSGGRAGVRVKVSSRPDEAAHFGRRAVAVTEPRDAASRDTVSGLFDEAADYVEVIRRLWDSWQDDAEIRDAATGRFVDRGKLHYIDFEGRWFSVRGPSITPRPPQGQPPVAALAHSAVPYQLVARSADLVVFLAPDAHAAVDRKARLDELAGHEYTSDAAVFTGTPAQLATLLQEWQQAGLSGFRLRPAGIPADLQAITRGLVPELQRRGVFRTSYDTGPLRGRLGLGRPASRYAASGRS